jgi:hypothetical protein
MSAENLVKHLQQILPDILQETPATLAYLYGSRAVGLALPTSDVDIALILGRENKDQPILEPQERLNLEFDVEAALEQQGVGKPDVRVIDDLPLTFRGEVATQGIRLYSRDEAARVEFETRTWKEFIDFKPVQQMMLKASLDHTRKHGLSNKVEMKHGKPTQG